MSNGTQPQRVEVNISGLGDPLSIDERKVRVELVTLDSFQQLPGRISDISCGEATPVKSLPVNNNVSMILRPKNLSTGSLSQEDLKQFEFDLRRAAISTNERFLLGMNATPTLEASPGNFVSLYQPSSTLASTLPAVGRGGIYQLMQFPIGRLNGVALPTGSSIRFADPTRWFSGALESRLFTVSKAGSNKFYAWDAHLPVGNHPHNYYHVNQGGMHSVFGHSNHSNLGGAQLVQAKQLRYLKIGGRVFLVVGVLVDTYQLTSAAADSVEQGNASPLVAQTVRTTGSWAMAWAGAKAGVLIGGALGVETGPGMVLTAIGGGIVGGFAGYLGADWIADFIYED